MSTHHVDEYRTTHTCPADPVPHTIVTRRYVAITVPGGPCLTPVTLHDGDHSTVIDCWRRNRHEQQCDNCRTVIVTGTVTEEHIGAVTRTRAGTATSAGPARITCTVCGLPLAAVFADQGRHLLCRHNPAAA